MTDKIELSLRGSFVFRFLVICIFFAIFLAAGSLAKDFNIPIYIQTSAGIEKASSSDIIDILSNHDFEIKKEKEYVPDEKCSLRAEGGSLEVDNEIFDSKNSLSFNIPLKNDGAGKGSLIVEKERYRFSLSFEVQEIIETNSDVLVFRASGEGRLNRKELNFDNIAVSFDKLNNKVDMEGTGDMDFQITGMKVSFTKWCLGEEKEFYLIIDKGKLKEPRSLEEIRKILDEHPELIDMYEGLGDLSKYAVIPEFGLIAGALTLIGAISIFFFVRKR